MEVEVLPPQAKNKDSSTTAKQWEVRACNDQALLKT
jgi:hypothetical protein